MNFGNKVPKVAGDGVITKVQRVYFAVEDNDRIDGWYGYEPVPHMRTATGRARSMQAFELADLMGKLIGCAVVWDGQQVTAIGTEETMSYWLWPLTPMKPATAEAADLLSMREEPPHPRARRFRERRISELRLKHKVAELFPTLRSWGDKSEEIVMRPEAGGLRLGGVLGPPL